MTCTKKVIKKTGIALIVLICMSGCDREDEAKWSEEVLLNDGSVAVVHRRATRASSSFLEYGRGYLRRNEFIYPPGNVRWGFFKGSAAQSILSFDVLDGVPFIVVSPSKRCLNKASEDFDVQFLRWQSNEWLEISQRDFSVELLRKNMTESYWGGAADQDIKGVVNWRDKLPSADLDFDNKKPKLLVDWLTERKHICGITRR
ncbi:hypothetical protein [Lysobacter sp. 22409]|uniref:hypothetical protein n=1 Tax=Lysobacter sp. 22409 TaxID=3453917 RepID=UPI003F84E41C